MEEQLLIQLYRKNKLIADLIESDTQKYGINHVQLYILMLSDENKMNVSMLAQLLNISKSAVSQAIVGLLLKRLIIKRFDESNKKIFYIKLTKKGKEIKEELMKCLLDKHQLIIEKFGKDELSNFTRLLEKFSDVLKEIMNVREEIC